VTTINQAMCMGGSCEGAKQSLWQAECRCSMLLEIQGMLILWERLNTVQMSEGGWEKSDESGRTPFWKKSIEVWLFLRTNRLVMVWVAKTPSRHVLTLLQHFILLTKHDYSSTMSLLLEDVVLQLHLHHSLPLRPPRKDSIHISRTNARRQFCNWAQ